ncbi:hypothetical protein [Halopseudomonas pelagia]|uniref:hypothetical protein n=1 Tax=Halopseudomonas pelagia TaxID=553151 RepID=UPI0003B502AC|nr:hypothetical protein [Halopseudomonas pelagia]
MRQAYRILKLANIAEASKADPIQLLEEICLKGEPAYILCPTAPTTLATYALERERSGKPWLPKQTLYESYSREISFFSDNTTSNSSFKIPPETFLKIPDEKLKLLTVHETIEVSRFSGTMTINIDNQFHQEVVARSPSSYFTPKKSNDPYPQKKNRIPFLMEHYIITTKCDSNYGNHCTEAPATISISDIWVHEDAAATAINSILTQWRQNHPWRTPALGILIETAEKFFKGSFPIEPTTPEERIKIESHLKYRLNDFTEKQIEICRILITPEKFNRKGKSNMQMWELSRDEIEDHISISLQHMINTAKHLNKVNLQSNAKRINEELGKIGPIKRKLFSYKKLNVATKAIKLNQGQYGSLENY